MDFFFLKLYTHKCGHLKDLAKKISLFGFCSITFLIIKQFKSFSTSNKCYVGKISGWNTALIAAQIRSLFGFEDTARRTDGQMDIDKVSYEQWNKIDLLWSIMDLARSYQDLRSRIIYGILLVYFNVWQMELKTKTLFIMFNVEKKDAFIDIKPFDP